MSKWLYRNYTYPSQMRKCNWEMVAVQELHPSVETAAHQMLKTKKTQKNERGNLFGVLLRQKVWEDFSRRVATLAYHSIFKNILENINLNRNLHFCKKIQAKPLT